MPFIAYPLWQSADRMHVTPVGGTAPSLGRDIPETPETRKARRGKDSSENPFVVGKIYSFSWNSKFIDLVAWKACKLPGELIG